MKNNWKEKVCRLGSLVGTDAKNPEENLIECVEILLAEQKKEAAEEQKRLFMLALVHLDSASRESVLNKLAGLQSLITP